MKKLTLLFCLLAMAGVAQILPPATTPQTRNMLRQSFHDAAVGLYGSGFDRLVFYEDFEWGTNSAYTSNEFAWFGPTNAYTFTARTGHKVRITQRAQTNEQYFAITNGAIQPSIANGHTDPMFYMWACLTNDPIYDKYFIVGMEYRPFRASTTSDTTNNASLAMHVGKSSLFSGNFYQVSHNLFWDVLNEAWQIQFYTNASNPLQGVTYKSVYYWAEPTLRLLEADMYNPKNSNSWHTFELGYVGDIGDKRVIYHNLDGFRTNYLIDSWMFDASWGTNICWQASHASFLVRNIMTIGKVWVRAPGPAPESFSLIEAPTTLRLGPLKIGWGAYANPNAKVWGVTGDIYLNTNGGASTTFWIKESGMGTTNGWVAK